MPIPMELLHATEDFDRFLADVCDSAHLATRNQAYTTAEAVLFVFRRRLDLKAAIRFAGVLPPVLRAIFVSDWDVDAPQRPFADRATLTREAQMLRQHHNFSPDTCIHDVAVALRRHIDALTFDTVLATLPEEAVEFWRV